MNEDESKKIGYYLERTTRIVKLRFNQAIKKLGLDLTPEQWVIIDTLSKSNGQSQSELAFTSFKDAPTISRIIDVLSRKGLVQRRRFKNDRRRNKIFLTPEGEKVVGLIAPVAANLRDQGWQKMNETDYGKFIKMMNQVFMNFEGE